MLLETKLKHVLNMVELARKDGCTRAELLLARDLDIDERVRMKCRMNVCGQYRQSLLCPPYVPELADVARMLARYNFAMLVQITQQVPDGNYREVFDNKKTELNNIILGLEKAAFRCGFTLALGLAAGHCELCPHCAAKDGEPICRNPQQARPSMEALGMDVEKTCRQIGFPAGFIAGEVTLTGMLLID